MNHPVIYRAALTALLLIPTYTMAMPLVSGNQISWQSDDWHQVQRADTFETVCEGSDSATSGKSGGQCTIDDGLFIVINHGTGERFVNISAGNSNPVNTPKVNEVTVVGHMISWPNDGWYQLQDANSFATMCQGVLSCSVQPGDYILINHTTGKRFENIRVGSSTNNNTPNNTDNDNPTDSISVVEDSIRVPLDGWYQIQQASNYKSICEGVTLCKVSAGNYIVINHTTGKRQEVTVLGSSPNNDSSTIIETDIEVEVPKYVSNELQVKINWGNKEFNIPWEADEYWHDFANFPAGVTNLLTVTFSDRNGQITLGTITENYTPQQIVEFEDYDIISYFAEDFDTEIWDDDADGISNIDELRRGTDPLVSNEPSSFTAFDLPTLAPTITDTFSGYQLDQFSSVVDDLAFIVSQQTTITWPDDAYYQVQHAYRFNTVCEGKSECNIIPGSYLVVNHDTGERKILDVPYVAPDMLSNNVALADKTFTIDDDVFQANSVNLKKFQYQCEHGGSLITGFVDESLDKDQSDYRNIERREYKFDQCKLTIRDSIIPNGTYVVQGSMYEDKRNYGGYYNNHHQNNYNYDNFSLIGDNGLEYRIDGNTYQYERDYPNYIDNRTANITLYQKIGLDGKIETAIRNSEYKLELQYYAFSFSVSTFEVKGDMRSPDTGNQWVNANTIIPFTQHWHSPNRNFDHTDRPFRGEYELTAEDGSSLNIEANRCFVTEQGDDCNATAKRFVNYNYVTTEDEDIQTVGVQFKYEVKDATVCEPGKGNLNRAHISPDSPYVNDPDSGRLECTASRRWQTDLYGRYTYGTLIYPERRIIIP